MQSQHLFGIPMIQINVGIVDDSPSDQLIISRLLVSRGINVSFQAGNGADLFERLKECTPDIILMDIKMPKMHGVEAARKLSTQYPMIKVITLTSYGTDEDIKEMFQHDVKAFLYKSDYGSLIEVVESVYYGKYFVNDRILSVISRYLRTRNGPEYYSTNRHYTLSKVESTILHFLRQGNTSRGIADRVCISKRTVENHIKEIYRKLDVHSKQELIDKLDEI